MHFQCVPLIFTLAKRGDTPHHFPSSRTPLFTGVRTGTNRHSIILGGEVRIRTNKQTHTHTRTPKTVKDISTPCLSVYVDKNAHNKTSKINQNFGIEYVIQTFQSGDVLQYKFTTRMLAINVPIPNLLLLLFSSFSTIRAGHRCRASC